MDSPESPCLVQDTASIPEGFARKALFDDPSGGPPREVLLCRFRGRLYGLDTLCPHEGGRLSEGPLVEGRYARCPLHLYKFDPRDGHAIEVECAPARTVEVRERGGDAEVVP